MKFRRSLRNRAARQSCASDARTAETLETRTLPTVSVFFLAGSNTLQVTSNSNDSITVRVSSADSTKVEVLANGIAVSSAGSILATDVDRMDIVGGDGNNVIDVTGVSASIYDNGDHDQWRGRGRFDHRQ